MRRNVKKQKRKLFYRISKSVFWRIDGKKRLVFFGRGSIPGYAPYAEFFRERPWKNEKFHTVVIGKGITDVHPTALHGVDLDHVVLAGKRRRGDGLEITEAGLYNHLKKELLVGRDQKRVVIAEGTVDIHPFAFAFHQKVKEIECPSSLQRIGISAFEGCRKLKHIYRIPADAIIGRAAFKDTNGLLIYYDRSLLKAKLHEIHPKSAFTDHGRAFLMNGEFVFFSNELRKNIDPTRFYRCKDLIDIKGGRDFIIGLRSNGEVLFEALDTFSGIFDCCHASAAYEEKSGYERLKGWKNITQILVAGKMAAGLNNDGKVFCTNSRDENQPLPNLSGMISLEIKDGKIYGLKDDWTMVPIDGRENSDEEGVLYF